MNGTWAVPPLQLPESGKHNPKRISALSKSPLSQWTTGLNPEPLGSPGLPYRPVLTEAAPRPAHLPPSPPLHLRPRIPPPAPGPEPSPSGLASPFVSTRSSQPSGARSSWSRMVRVWERPACPAALARRLETSRRGRRSRCHALGPPRGRCRAVLPGGRVSCRLARTRRLSESGQLPAGPSLRLPGPSAAGLLPPVSGELHSDRKEEGRRGRGNNFYTPDPAPSLDGIDKRDPRFPLWKVGFIMVSMRWAWHGLMTLLPAVPLEQPLDKPSVNLSYSDFIRPCPKPWA